MAEERGLAVDKQGFEAAMEAAKERSRAAGKRSGSVGIKFEAEATGWLQNKAVALTVRGRGRQLWGAMEGHGAGT